MRRLPELGLVGEDIEGYGCPGMSPLAARAGAHGAAPRRRQPRHVPRRPGGAGDEVDRDARLGGAEAALAAGDGPLEAIGAFALTEPDHGSDSVALETTARRDGDDWVLDGDKRWIGNGSIADVVVVWARDSRGRPGQGLPRRDRPRPGYDATTMTARARRARSGRPTSRSTASGCPTRTGCRRADVQGHRPRARHHAHHVRLGRARPRRGGLRRRADLRQAAHSSSASRCVRSRSSRTGS